MLTTFLLMPVAVAVAVRSTTFSVKIWSETHRWRTTAPRQVAAKTVARTSWRRCCADANRLFFYFVKTKININWIQSESNLKLFLFVEFGAFCFFQNLTTSFVETVFLFFATHQTSSPKTTFVKHEGCFTRHCCLLLRVCFLDVARRLVAPQRKVCLCCACGVLGFWLTSGRGRLDVLGAKS